jgi:hypothetical protein
MRSVTIKAGRTGMVCGFILLQVACGAAFAQSAETPAASAAPAAEPTYVPFGGCEPIGMTASGELVFPLECKHKIQLQPAPVASDDKAPAADDKPVTSAETRPAVTDTPAAMPEKAADKPPVETKAAAVEDKPVAAPETLAVTDKMPAPAEKAVEAKPAAAVVAKAEDAKAEDTKAEDTKAEDTKAEDTKAEAAKAETEKPVKRVSRRAARAAATRQAVAKQSVAKQFFAMAKPAQVVATSAHAEDKTATVQTAGLLPCSHYRSYNPASKSYRGFDGHMYACH